MMPNGIFQYIQAADGHYLKYRPVVFSVVPIRFRYFFFSSVMVEILRKRLTSCEARSAESTVLPLPDSMATMRHPAA